MSLLLGNLLLIAFCTTAGLCRVGYLGYATGAITEVRFALTDPTAAGRGLAWAFAAALAYLAWRSWKNRGSRRPRRALGWLGYKARAARAKLLAALPRPPRRTRPAPA